jgi:hypothetical protein
MEVNNKERKRTVIPKLQLHGSSLFVLLSRQWWRKSMQILFLTLEVCTTDFRKQGSSVSIVSDYRLDEQAIKVQSVAEAKDFSSNLCVQAASGAHPASYPMGPGGPFPVVKCSWGMTLTTHPHLVLRPRMSRSYTSSPQALACSGTAILLQQIWIHTIAVNYYSL